ncbi:MAG: alpha/beta hydrolase-fold protein [Polyangiaceae bacterium]
MPSFSLPSRFVLVFAPLALVSTLHCSDSGTQPGSVDAGDTNPGADAGKADTGAKDAGVGDAGGDTGTEQETTIVVHITPGGADPVSIRGDKAPLNWDADAPMVNSGNGTFTYVVPKNIAKLEFKPRYKSTWARGPNYTVEHGKRIDVYPHFFTTSGTVTRGPEFQSAYLAKPRRIWTYLPPTYIENEAARFPVIYMHDGANLFDPNTAFGGVEWKVDETMNAGAESGAIREAIIIGVESTADRIDELTPSKDSSVGTGGHADEYIKMISLELKPKYDQTLRTLTTADQTGIMGSSLGGLVSVYAGAKYAGTFGLVGAMSPSTWWDGRMIIGVVMQMPLQPRPLKFYVDSGDSGASNDDVVNTADLAKAIKGMGYFDGKSLQYVVQQGASHSETYWAQRLPGALAFLLGPGR